MEATLFRLLLIAQVFYCAGLASTKAHMLDGIPYAKIGSLSDVIEARFPRGTPTSLQPTTPPSKSQINPTILASGEYMTVNLLKIADYWNYLNTGAPALPTDLDADGYPLNGSTMMTTGGGAVARVKAPAQAVRPGNYVISGARRGTTLVFDQNSGNSQGAGCAGTASGGNNLQCNNAACTSATGGINGQTLTITVASSCNLAVGQPITNASTTESEFGVPTIVIGKSGSANCPTCTGTGGTGTYLVNFSQTIAPGSTLIPGLRAEVSIPTRSEDTNNFGSPPMSQWQIRVLSTDATNPLTSMAFYHIDDELVYASGQLGGPKYLERMRQSGVDTARNLGPGEPNSSNESTWWSRKPKKYWSWQATEMRASIFYPKAQVTYALNGSSNDYSINTGAAQVDKQTICVQFPTSPTNTTITLSTDNGATKSRVNDYRGTVLTNSSAYQADKINGYVYDAFANVWISTSAQGNGGGQNCLDNWMPPEAYLRVLSEIGTIQYPWIISPMMASDPITDYQIQHAKFTLANYPQFLNIYEVTNEPWGCGGAGTGPYASLKSAAYAAVSTPWFNNRINHFACITNGDNFNWAAKAASLLGQAIRSVSPTYIVAVGAQLVGNGTSSWNDLVLSTSYVQQSPSDIPIQSGCAGATSIQTSCPTPFTQTAAYQAMKSPVHSFGAAVVVSDYWATGDWINTNDYVRWFAGEPITPGPLDELPRAWCYFYQAGGCASQASLMAATMATNNIVSHSPTLQTNFTNWRTFANGCAGGSSCTPMIVMGYEGGFSYNGQATDVQITSTSRSSSPPNTTFTLPVNPAGGAAGIVVKVDAASGGTWSSIVGNTYTIGSASGATWTIPLDSSALGTLTSITFSYVNSANYLSYFRNMATASTEAGTLTTTLYDGMAKTTGWCSPNRCAYSPSLSLLSGPITTVGTGAGQTNLVVWSSDIYGYLPVASCSSCSVSGTSLTLGGTMSGIFTPGLALMGQGVNLQTITGTCSQTGAGPAGSNAGDVCPISASLSATSNVSMSGNLVPPLNGLGNSTTSPAKQWGATCAWNGNASQCRRRRSQRGSRGGRGSPNRQPRTRAARRLSGSSRQRSAA